jgi:hypothetical protein
VLTTLLTAAEASAGGRAEECAAQAEHALLLQDTGHPVSALEEFQACAAETCPKVVRDDCRRAILEIRKTAPRLFFRVREPSGLDLVDASLSLDGQPVSTDDRARGRFVDPGVHVVRASTATAATVTRSVLVAATDRERIVEIVLTQAPAAAPAPEPPRRDHTLGLVVGGVGLSLLTTSGVVGATAVSSYRALEERCGSACSAEDVSSLRTRIVVTDVLLAAGIVSLVAAGVLWVLAPERAR